MAARGEGAKIPNRLCAFSGKGSLVAPYFFDGPRSSLFSSIVPFWVHQFYLVPYTGEASDRWCIMVTCAVVRGLVRPLDFSGGDSTIAPKKEANDG